MIIRPDPRVQLVLNQLVEQLRLLVARALAIEDAHQQQPTHPDLLGQVFVIRRRCLVLLQVLRSEHLPNQTIFNGNVREGLAILKRRNHLVQCHIVVVLLEH